MQRRTGSAHCVALVIVCVVVSLWVVGIVMLKIIKLAPRCDVGLAATQARLGNSLGPGIVGQKG